MVHDLLFYTLLLLGILGLCASLIWVWRRRPRSDQPRHHTGYEACTSAYAMSRSHLYAIRF
jgi:hypothetical protein